MTTTIIINPIPLLNWVIWNMPEAAMRVAAKKIEEFMTCTLVTPELKKNKGRVEKKQMIKKILFLLFNLSNPKKRRGNTNMADMYFPKAINE